MGGEEASSVVLARGALPMVARDLVGAPRP